MLSPRKKEEAVLSKEDLRKELEAFSAGTLRAALHESLSEWFRSPDGMTIMGSMIHDQVRCTGISSATNPNDTRNAWRNSTTSVGTRPSARAEDNLRFTFQSSDFRPSTASTLGGRRSGAVNGMCAQPTRVVHTNSHKKKSKKVCSAKSTPSKTSRAETVSTEKTTTDSVVSTPSATSKPTRAWTLQKLYRARSRITNTPAAAQQSLRRHASQMFVEDDVADLYNRDNAFYATGNEDDNSMGPESTRAMRGSTESVDPGTFVKAEGRSSIVAGRSSIRLLHEETYGDFEVDVDDELHLPPRPLVFAQDGYTGYTAMEKDIGDAQLQARDLSRLREPTWHEFLERFTESTMFHYIVGAMVLLNAAALGIDTEYRATHDGDDQCTFTMLSEAFFCFIFTVELSLRIFVHRREFFGMDKPGNWLDACLVFCQLIEQSIFLLSGVVSTQASTLRILRLLRVIRIVRLIRTVHLFDDLRVMVSSIVSSASSLGWSMVLLCMAIYIFSLVFLQVIVSAPDTPHRTQIRYWFRNLPRTILTMFEAVVGGVSWDAVVSPLVTDISPLMGVMFCLYVALCMFAMMNLLTGIFVDKAMRTVREDKDVMLAAGIRDLFMTTPDPSDWRKMKPIEEEEEEITWEVFLPKLQTHTMQDYFRQINVEITQARALFELIDLDGNGSLDSSEIVDGCLRLRGPARALDLALLMREVSDMHKEQLDFRNDVLHILEAEHP